MQRHLGRAFTASICPLIGFAGLLAMSGCAAMPAIGLANSLLRPAPTAPIAQTAPNGTTAPAPDIFSALAQRLGITLPPPPPAAIGGPAGDDDDRLQITGAASTFPWEPPKGSRHSYPAAQQKENGHG
jgi:hypothetical protein